MSNLRLAITWGLFFLIIFVIGYMSTAIVYMTVMKDLVVKGEYCPNTPGLIVDNPSVGNCTFSLIEVTDQLEVKEVPKGFIQNLQVYEEQPATTPIGKEL